MNVREMTAKELHTMAENAKSLTNYDMAMDELDRRASVCIQLTYGVNGFCSYCGLPASCHEY
jgi:tRNA A37 methylthiotransferase MiaB